MHARTLVVLFAALFATALVTAQNPPGLPGGGGQPPVPPDRSKDDKAAGQLTTTLTNLDGNWAVVAASRGGRAVDGADKMTVTIKGGVVTFEGTDPKAGMRAVRLDAGANGTLRVAEAGADGKFGPGTVVNPDRAGVGGPGTNTPPSQIGGGGTPPDRTSGAGSGMTGVYVQTGDYLAVSVFGAPASAPAPAGTAPQSYMSVVLKRANRP